MEEEIAQPAIPAAATARAIKPIERSAVSKICSGQVILDLSTAVKELVENALDAGATTVEVRLKEHGLALIEVADNGRGVRVQDHEALAAKYHTSKIRGFGDLEALTTFGFRGEALSSLCALGSVSVVTRTADDDAATRLEYDAAGALARREPCARAVGTTVAVRELFSPLPVRRQELARNVRRELAKLRLLLQQYAVMVDGAQVYASDQAGRGARATLVAPARAGAGLAQRVAAVLGTKLAALLQPVEAEVPGVGRAGAAGAAGGALISGLVSRAGSGVKGDRVRQFVCINGRPVELPRVLKAASEAYRSLYSSLAAAKPLLFLNLMLPPGSFDVNVTPDKRTVFVQQESAIVAALVAALQALWEPARYTYSAAAAPGAFDAPPARLAGLTPPAGGRRRLPPGLAGSDDEDEEEEEEEEEEGDDEEEEDEQWQAGHAGGGAGATPRPLVSFMQAGSSGGTQPTPLQQQLQSLQPRSARAPSPAAFAPAPAAAASPSPSPAKQGLRPAAAALLRQKRPRVGGLGAAAAGIGAAAGVGSFALGAHGAAAAAPKRVQEEEEEEEEEEQPLAPAPMGVPTQESEEDDNDGHAAPMDEEEEEEAASAGRSTGGGEEDMEEVVVVADTEQQQGSAPVAPPPALASFMRGGGGGGALPPPQRDEEDEEEGGSPPGGAPAAAAAAAGGGKRGDGRQRTLAAFGFSARPAPPRDTSAGAAADAPPLEAAPPPPSQEPPSSQAAADAAAGGTGAAAAADDDEPVLTAITATPAAVTARAAAAPAAPPPPAASVRVSYGLHELLATIDARKRRLLQQQQRQSTEPATTTAAPGDRAAAAASSPARAAKRRRLQAASLQLAPGGLRAADTAAAAAGNAADAAAAANANATAELARVFDKAGFAAMAPLGQFNLGFIVGRLGADLYIVDQHAADEKSTFERLSASLVLNQQPLLAPRRVPGLGALEAALVRRHAAVFRRSGFGFVEVLPGGGGTRPLRVGEAEEEDAAGGRPEEEQAGEEEAGGDELPWELGGELRAAGGADADDGDGATLDDAGGGDDSSAAGGELLLASVPYSRGAQLGPDDVSEMLEALSSGEAAPRDVRPKRVREMLASRACRSSIMIGRALDARLMRRVVSRLAELDAPWNCPHGRPTMRHLALLPAPMAARVAGVGGGGEATQAACGDDDEENEEEEDALGEGVLL